MRSLLLSTFAIIISYWFLFYSVAFNYKSNMQGFELWKSHGLNEYWNIMHEPARTYPGTFPEKLLPVVQFLIKLNKPIFIAQSLGYSEATQRFIEGAWPHAIPKRDASINIILTQDLENKLYSNCAQLFNHLEYYIVRCNN